MNIEAILWKLDKLEKTTKTQTKRIAVLETYLTALDKGLKALEKQASHLRDCECEDCVGIQT